MTDMPKHDRLFAPFILFLCVTLLIVTACDNTSATDTTDSRSQAVQQYLTAKVASDRDGIAALLCSELEASLDRETASFDSVSADIENMVCIPSDTDDAVVTCTGEIVADYGGESTVFPLSAYNVVEEDGTWRWCGEAADR